MPSVPFAGVAVKAVPPQIVLVIAVTYGVGFTVTVTVKVAPVQLSALLGVTVYVAVATALVVLVNVWLMFDWPVPWALPPVRDNNGSSTGADHV